MVAEVVPDDVVVALKNKLKDPKTTLPQKYRILFSLRNVKGRNAHDALLVGMEDDSALLRHEIAYCLGQRQDPAAVKLLQHILEDKTEHPMVRHEAGEALGAIATPECLEPLRAYLDDDCVEVAQTCQLALQRLMYQRAKESNSLPAEHEILTTSESPFFSVDPTPAAPSSIPTVSLRQTLLDESAPMFDRYTAMFGLRNRGGEEAIGALAASFDSRSALLKHEVAYVLGQMQDPQAVEVLRRVLEDGCEAAMVRHEAAEALGAIADTQCMQLLKQYAQDQEPIVAHSCQVALDMLEYETSGGFQYADVGTA